MKTGTTASPSRYDAVACHALQSTNLRRTTILHYAPWAGAFPTPQRGPLALRWRLWPINITIDLMHQIQRWSPSGERHSRPALFSDHFYSPGRFSEMDGGFFRFKNSFASGKFASTAHPTQLP
jgi:hypothetical protein